MGGLMTKILNQSDWIVTKGNVESPVFAMQGIVGIEISIKGMELTGSHKFELFIQESFIDGFGYPKSMEQFSGCAKMVTILAETYYRNNCRFLIASENHYQYRYGFMYYWLMSDQEIEKEKNTPSDIKVIQRPRTPQVAPARLTTLGGGYVIINTKFSLIYGIHIHLPTLSVIKNDFEVNETVKYPTLRVGYTAGCQ